MGDNLIVTPVVDSGATSRKVYLPAGQWYRVGSNEAASGGAVMTASAPGVMADGGDTTALKGLPIWARAGAVIPMQRPMLHDGAMPLDTLELHVYPGSATSMLYEDAGDGYGYQSGQYRVTTMRTSSGAKTASVAFTRSGQYAGAKAFVVTLHAVARPASVRADGRKLATSYDASRRELRFTVPGTVRSIDVAR